MPARQQPRKRTRREWGTGSIREVTPGKYVVVVDIGTDPFTQRRRQITRTVNGTKGDAQRVVDDLKRSAAPTATATVTQLIDAWLPDAGHAEQTRQSWGYVIDKWITPTIGPLPLGQLTPPLIGDWHKRLRKLGAKPHAVKNAHNILSSALTTAVAWGWIPDNPARKAVKPRTPKADPKSPPIAVVRDLIAAGRDNEERLWLRLYATVSGRRSEVLAIRWSDIRFYTDGDGNNVGELTIERTLTAPGRTVSEKATKAGDTRRLGLDAGLTAMLADHLEHCRGRASDAGTTLREDGYVLAATLDGSVPWSPSKITRRFAKVRKQVPGAKGWTIRSLRHFAPSQGSAAGFDVRTLMDHQGHSSSAMTLGVYTNTVDGRERALADHIGSLLD